MRRETLRLATLACALVLAALGGEVDAQTTPDAAETAAAARNVSSHAGSDVGYGADYDPWEAFNRPMFAFNDGFDQYLLKPVAQGWNAVLPHPVQHAVDNVFDNAKFPVRFVNDLLQGEIDPAAVALCRFAVNTTAGIGGLFDWATDMGLPKVTADFGETLGRWGVAPGPYIVWPILGSSNPRDTVGIVVDSYLDIATLFGDFYTLAAARVVQTVNTRSLLLGEIANAREASLDFYVAVRTAYYQRRQSLIRGSSETETAVDESLYFPDYSDQEVAP
jgi:phospholipid-binding lipoprotein MlaA